jgi:putative spermidine/putrescine transport system ATP-binding protein
MVQMGAFANRRPAQLSGGQQQRIALARALVFDPSLVLMDEPLGALDKQLREHMQFEIKHLHESLGITVVYVTHDQGEALTMSDRIAVFNDGRIQQLAPPAGPVRTPRQQLCRAVHRREQQAAGHDRGNSGDKALVRLGTGELIDATPVNVSEKGQKTLVSIRPERVEFKPEMMPPDAHTMDAEVVEVIYMGDILRTVLKVAGADDFVMKMRNTLGQTRADPGRRSRWAGIPRMPARWTLDEPMGRRRVRPMNETTNMGDCQ